MKATVIGKEYVKGVAKKTGNPFEANVVHITYKKNKVEGQSCESVWLDPEGIPSTPFRLARSTTSTEIAGAS